MTFQELPLEKQALFLIGFTIEGEKFLSKVALMPERVQAQIQEEYVRFQQLKSDERKGFLMRNFKTLSSQRSIKFFHSIHPDWILKRIEREPPYIIGAILRFLPGECAGYILKNLPAGILDSLPKLKESFHAEALLIQYLRDKLISEFTLEGFENQAGLRAALPEWSMTKVSAFFKELGLNELALAFSTLPQKVSKALLSRMSAEESDQLSKRIGHGEKVSESRIKKAQGHLLSLEMGEGSSGELVIETGFFIFTKTLLSPLGPYFLSIERKFPLKLAAVLRRYAEKHVLINFEETIEPYIEELETALSKFQSQWKRNQSKLDETNIKIQAGKPL